MKVFFDNCTSPVMARTLHGFISGENNSAVHLRDLPLHHPKDVEWIKFLSEEGSEWIVVTGDDRIRRNKAERTAFRQANLKGVVLSSAYEKSPMSRRCAALICQWPKLIDTMARFDPPILFEISINFSGRFKQLSL